MAYARKKSVSRVSSLGRSSWFKYWDLGTSPGNYSVEAFKQMRALRDGRAIRRDTSVLYSSPGSSISGTKIEQGGPGGWRVLRIRVEDAYVEL